MTCAIYCRLSKEDAGKIEESESIQNQKNMLISYAVTQEWDIHNIYCDEDYSGVDRERPGWRKMLRDAQAGKFQVILCKTQSRFTRDMEMVEKYIHGLFPLWGVRFVALVDNIDTDVKGGKKARQISGLINEWYLEDLSENVKAVLDGKRRQGKHIGSFSTYGYRKDPEHKGELLVDEEAAPTVRRIFSLYLEGNGTHAIAGQLNAEGTPSPGAYKQEKGLPYQNGTGTISCQWTSTAVSRILRNEMYLGIMVQGTHRKASYKSKKLLPVPQEMWFRVEGTHPALVDRESFDTVQRRMKLQTRSDGSGRTHPLAGKLRCADCGSTMIKVSYRYKGEQRCYFQCGAYAKARKDPACTRHSIPMDRLMGLVGERIRHYVGRYYGLGDVQRFQLLQQDTGREKELGKELAALKAQEIRLKDALKALYLDKVDGTLDEEDFAEINQSLHQDKQAVSARIKRLKAQLTEATKPEQDLATLRAKLERLLELEIIDRNLLDLLVDKIQVGEKDMAAGTQEVTIHWRF